MPGPRILTSLGQISNPKMTPDEMRAEVRKKKAEGADLVKIFASASIRDGGVPTLSQEQLDAVCAEAKAQGLRSMVHAHSPESMMRAARAGCTVVEHGGLATPEALKLLADRGVYFDPNIGLVTQNYLENKARFLGIGNYTEEGFASMEKALGMKDAMFSAALKTPGLKMVMGTDAVAGAHGQNMREILERVKSGQTPADAILSLTSISAASLRMEKGHRDDDPCAPARAGRPGGLRDGPRGEGSHGAHQVRQHQPHPQHPAGPPPPGPATCSAANPYARPVPAHLGRVGMWTFTLDQLPWTLLGASVVGDLIPMQDSLNEALRGSDDGLQQWVRRSVAADKRAMPKSALDALDTRKAGVKFNYNPAAGEPFKLLDGPEPNVFGIYHDHIEFLKKEIEDTGGVAGVTQLAQMGQMPSADTLERYLEALSPILRLLRSASNMPGRAAARLTKTFEPSANTATAASAMQPPPSRVKRSGAPRPRALRIHG